MASAKLRRGHTLLEITISTGIVALLVLAAATASKVAIVASADVTSAETKSEKSGQTLSILEQQLLSASSASLQGVPASKGQVAENMLANTSYSDLRFRKVVGFANGAAVYDPPTNQNALKIARNVDRKGRGTLVLVEGQTTTTLLDDVRSALFSRNGDKLSMAITYGDAASGTTVSTTLNFFLKVP